MAIQQLLKSELITDPLARGYSGMSNINAAIDIGITLYRPAKASVEELRKYFLLERKNSMSLMGRLKIVASGTVGTDPLGDSVTLTLSHITACQAVFQAINPGSVFSLDLNDTRFITLLDEIAGGSGAKVIAPIDKTAIIALSSNKQTRANELNLGRVREGDIQRARA